MQIVGIFKEKFGGDKWGFLIAEMGIFALNFLETLPLIHFITGFDRGRTSIFSNYFLRKTIVFFLASYLVFDFFKGNMD